MVSSHERSWKKRGESLLPAYARAISEQEYILVAIASYVNRSYNSLMHIWDYREKDLKKTEWGRRYILQNMINYGPGRRKISLKLVKKYWNNLDIEPLYASSLYSNVDQLTDMPVMKKKLTLEAMKKFFLNEAKELAAPMIRP